MTQYICAHCGAIAETDEQLIDDGTTWRCTECGGLTVVRLIKASEAVQIWPRDENDS
ncbi:MAG: hypothetical protein GY832_25975 [Chloroflexi bacterium]|nr:hypothetical protein [Chloroflexota bacterium]